MDTALKIIGLVFIVLGIIGGAFVYVETNNAVNSIEQLQSSNQDAEAKQIVSNAVNKAKFTNFISSVVTVFSGLVAGFFFLGLAKIIELLSDINDGLKEVDET